MEKVQSAKRDLNQRDEQSRKTGWKENSEQKVPFEWTNGRSYLTLCIQKKRCENL